MIAIGLTGGVATGKSTVLGFFRKLKIPTLSADTIVADLYSPVRNRRGHYNPLVRKIAKLCGPGSVGAHGKLNRSFVGRAVFSKPRLRHAIERLIHPMVMKKIDAELRKLRRREAKLAVVEIPLLFEGGHTRRFQKIVVVRAPAQIQLARVRKRFHLTATEARQRIASQWPLTKKIARADHVIDGFGSLAKTANQVATFVREVAPDRVRRGRRHGAAVVVGKNHPGSRRSRAK